MYFESFSRHRISPYDPTPLDDIRVQFLPEADPPRAEFDFSAFDAALERAVSKYHFTGLRLPIEGMGGGTFHDRIEPRIGAYGEDTPQYQAMFASYVKQLEDHFREKGWLEMPYVYWFDEPEPKDYDFVRRGFERLKRYAPGLRTMLTEEPVEALAGPVDIWCPLTANYDHAQAENRRAAGDRFWWYVCTGPKAPYCTLFIDHPATELRVWHWQTWQRGDRGHARLGQQLLDFLRRVSRPAPEPLRRSDGLRQRLFNAPGHEAVLGQRRRPVHLSAFGRRRAGPIGATSPRTAGLQHPLGNAPRRRGGLRVPVPAPRIARGQAGLAASRQKSPATRHCWKSPRRSRQT